MQDFQNFLIKAIELYLAAPAFFLWLGPTIVGTWIACAGIGYWVGNKLASAATENLKAQVAAANERLQLAKERADDAKQKAEELQKEMEIFKSKRAQPEGIRESASSAKDKELEDFGRKINDLVTANTAVSTSLGGPSVYDWISDHRRHLEDKNKSESKR